MRSILGEEASKAAKKQTMEKLKTLREVIEEMSKEREYVTYQEALERWKPFRPYLEMSPDELPLDFETHVRCLVRRIVGITGGNTHSDSEEFAVDVAKEIIYYMIQEFPRSYT